MFNDLARQRLATVIRELRGERSQKEFSSILDVSQSTITNWESGRGGTPNLDNLEKIAKEKGQYPEVLLAELYGREVRAITLINENELLLEATAEDLLQGTTEISVILSVPVLIKVIHRAILDYLREIKKIHH